MNIKDKIRKNYYSLRKKKYYEIKNLNLEIDKFKKAIEKSNSLYESMLDRTTKSLEEIIQSTESKSKIQ